MGDKLSAAFVRLSLIRIERIIVPDALCMLSLYDAQHLSVKKRSHQGFLANTTTQIIFYSKFCLMFIPDILYSPGLARNSFLQGDTCTNIKQE